MSDLPKKQERIFITKTHLLSLSFTTLSLGLLTFAIGYKMGTSQAAVEEQIPITLLPETSSQDTLEALLREIERKEENKEAPDYSFPDENRPQPVVKSSLDKSSEVATTQLRQGDVPPPKPQFSEQELPTSGWSVQIGSYKTLEEAQEKIMDLQKNNLSAYYVIAMIRGKNWYRVRVGGFTTQKIAEDGKKALERKLGEKGYITAKAP